MRRGRRCQNWTIRSLRGPTNLPNWAADVLARPTSYRQRHQKTDNRASGDDTMVPWNDWILPTDFQRRWVTTVSPDSLSGQEYTTIQNQFGHSSYMADCLSRNCITHCHRLLISITLCSPSIGLRSSLSAPKISRFAFTFLPLSNVVHIDHQGSVPALAVQYYSLLPTSLSENQILPFGDK